MHRLVGTLGEDEENMICVDVIATAPEFQGHGYGKALLNAINNIV